VEEFASSYKKTYRLTVEDAFPTTILADGKTLISLSDRRTVISEGKGSIRFWDAGNGKERDRICTSKTYHALLTTILADEDKSSCLAGGEKGVTISG